MLDTGFHDTTVVPVNWPSSILSLIGRPVIADEELPVQLSVMIPPASEASAALPSSGRSAACCAAWTLCHHLSARIAFFAAKLRWRNLSGRAIVARRHNLKALHANF